jgi:hypothetical protein
MSKIDNAVLLFIVTLMVKTIQNRYFEKTEDEYRCKTKKNPTFDYSVSSFQTIKYRYKWGN